MKWLMEPLLNESERTEPETVILDLALNMIRNLLQVDSSLDKDGQRANPPHTHTFPLSPHTQLHAYIMTFLRHSTHTHPSRQKSTLTYMVMLYLTQYD